MALIVNGQQIEDSQIQDEVERLRPHYERAFANQSPKEQEAQLLDWSRENVIERVLINQEAKRLGKKVSTVEVESALEEFKKQYQAQGRPPEELDTRAQEKIKKDIESQIGVDQLLQDVCKDMPEPSSKAVLKFYEENKEQFKSPEQVRVSHIVKHLNWQTDEVTALNLMKEVQNKLANGGIFETLARKYSDCPENGGDLGYIAKGQMVEEFEDVVFNLAVGQISNIFRTRFGFHIAKLYDRKPPVIHSLDEVRGHIVNRLKEQGQRDVVDEFVDQLKSKAKIEQV